MSSVHVVISGRNETIDFTDLFTAGRRELVGLPADGDISIQDITEAQVKHALTDYFDVPEAELRDHYVELNSGTGNVTVRPDAKFGS